MVALLGARQVGKTTLVRAPFGLLLYDGDHPIRLGERLLALPWPLAVASP